MIWMWFPLFGMWWWILALTFFIWITVAEECDSLGGLVAGLLFWFLLTGFFGPTFLALHWIIDHPIYTLLTPVIFLLIGFGYGLFRWWWDQRRALVQYHNKRREFFYRNKIIPREGVYNENVSIPDEHLNKWQGAYGTLDLHKTFDDEKGTIAWRMTLWPFSFVNFLLRDFVVRLYEMDCREWFVLIEMAIWGDVSSDNREVIDISRDEFLKSQLSPYNRAKREEFEKNSE